MSSFLSSVIPSASVSTNSVMTQTQHLNIPEKDNIWSNILKNVASTKVVPTKNILVLGEPGVGKSTLVHYLQNDPGQGQSMVDENDDTPFIKNNHDYTQTNHVKHDLALSYSFVDVKDDENEAMARLGLYQLSLSSPEYLPLLKFAINSETISDSCVLILLDWTRPWKFIETLQNWISLINHITDSIIKEGQSTESSWSKGRAILDDLKEKLEHYIQTYNEPTTLNHNIIVTESISTSSIVSNSNHHFLPSNSTQPSTVSEQVVLPLSPGVLTTNTGLPIIIVCCKSDAMNKLEQTHDYGDDQFDFIQQTLRTIAMKYGAALFYTSTLYPYTYHYLREYILHRVLSGSKSYPFHTRAQVIERDSVMVPSGWDSWPKIKILRDTFDCESTSEGWDLDLEAVLDRQKPSQAGLRGMFEESIPNGESQIEPLHVPTTILCEDEQSFFDRHFEKLQKNHESPVRTGADKSPTAAIQNMIRGGTNVAEKQTERSNRKKDTTLEKLLMKGTKPNGVHPNLGITTQNLTPVANPTPASVTNPNAPSHEVLANFFQSLLKSSSGAASPTTINSPASGAPLISTGPTGISNNRTNHKDLDVMRQYTISK